LLNALITSQTRIKLLLKFFLNSRSSSYLRGLESEFGESTNAIRLELNRLEDAGLLDSYSQGNKKMFKANTGHPLFPEINSIVMKMTGLDQVLERVVMRLGELKKVYVTGAFATGRDSDVIDLVFIGDHIERTYLLGLIEKAEETIKRKIRYLIYNTSEYELRKENLNENGLLIWEELS